MKLKRSRCKVIFCFLLFGMMLGCGGESGNGSSSSSTGQDSSKTITVDSGSQMGSFRGLYDGVNAGPYSYKWDKDLSLAADEIGLTWFRVHDMAGGGVPSPGDIPQIYGDTGAGDITDPANYDFSTIDPLIAEAVNKDYNVLYRLGRSWSYPPLDSGTDPVRWAEAAHRIIMHFNEGWNNGHYYNIRYWEIFNEPDLSVFWAGTREQWFAFFDTVFSILKGYYPDLKIGCCGFAGIDREWRTAFLEYCANKGLDPDFISWHLYNYGIPEIFMTEGEAWQIEMDKHSLTGENLLTEWGMFGSGTHPENANASGAAFYAAALTYMQDSPIDMAFRYRIDGNEITTPDDGGFNMINPDPGLTLKIPTCSFKAFKWLSENTPVRINADGSNTAAGYAVIAGRSPDDRMVQVIIGDLRSEHTGYNLMIRDLPWGTATYTYERYVINDSLCLELVESGEGSGVSTFQTKEDLAPPAVHLIKLYTQ